MFYLREALHSFWTRPDRWLLLLFLVPWAAIFTFLVYTSWFLCDDAFISFRYVRNWVDGYGLVFNVGERVEGYTNFLWVLELGVLWKIFGIRPEQGSLLLSSFLTLGTLAATLAMVPKRRFWIGWMALGLLMCNSTFAVWTSSGLETRQFTFFIVLAVALLAQRRRSNVLLIIASISLGASELTRPEGIMLGCLTIGWFFLDSLYFRRFSIRKMLCMALPFSLIVAGHFAFRLSYYNEWLPNTYYAKHVRPWYDSGIRYFAAVSLETGLYLLLPLAALGAWAVFRRQKNSIHLLSLLLIFFHINYLMRVGGDHFEFRPLDFYWPLLAVPAAVGIVAISGKWSAPFFPSKTVQFIQRQTKWLVFSSVLIYSSVLQAAILHKSSALTGRTETYSHHVEIAPTEYAMLRWLPMMPYIVEASNRYREQMTRNVVGLRAVEHREFKAWLSKDWKHMEALENQRELFPEDALHALSSVGVEPFYLYGLRVVDRHGLVDYEVARISPQVVRKNARRKMAHDKLASHPYLRKRGVNFYPQRPRGEKRALRTASYAIPVATDLWLPFEASDALWAQKHFTKHGLISRHRWSITEASDNLYQRSLNSFYDEQTQRFVGSKIIDSFEKGLGQWTVESGDCFTTDVNNMTHLPPVFDVVGNYLSSSSREGTDQVGIILSPEFNAQKDQRLVFRFLVSAPDIWMQLLVDGQKEQEWRPEPSEPKQNQTTLYSVDLNPYAGKSLQLKLIDNNKDGYAFLDHIIIVEPE